MATLDENSVDAVVTDLPYGLEFMGKQWDKLAVPKSGNLGGFATGNKPSFERVRSHLPAMQDWHESWARAALRILKPGGHLLAFGGTRTHHRLMCGIEDAGFEIRDCLMWLYGSGFPKSKAVGDGWGTALKPGWEAVVMARKPMSERNVAANVARWGTGAINVNGCRIAPAGRWPANVALDEEGAELLDEQSGELTSGVATKVYTPTLETSQSLGAKRRNLHPGATFGDSGGASRFFYTSKTSGSERNRGVEDRESGNHHPTVKPIALMAWLARLVTPARGLVLDPFCGSGSTGIAAVREGFDFIGIDQDGEYVEIARARVVGDAPLLTRIEPA